MRKIILAIAAMATFFSAPGAARQLEVPTLSDLKAQLREVENRIFVAEHGGVLVRVDGRPLPIALSRDEVADYVTELVLLDSVPTDDIAPLIRYLVGHRQDRLDDLKLERVGLNNEISKRSQQLAGHGVTADQFRNQVLGQLDASQILSSAPSREQIAQGAAIAAGVLVNPRQPTNQDIFNAFAGLGQAIGAVAGNGSRAGATAQSPAPYVNYPLPASPGQAPAPYVNYPIPNPPAGSSSGGVIWAGRYAMGGNTIATVAGSGSSMTARWTEGDTTIAVGACSVSGNRAQCVSNGSYAAFDVTVLFTGQIDVVHDGNRISGTHTILTSTPQWKVQPYPLTALTPGAVENLSMTRLN